MTSFGEIIEPSSRTAWEDWDDIVLQESIPVLHLREKLQVPAEIEIFLILEGKYFYDYIKAQQDGVEYVNCIPESSEIVELLKEFIIKSDEVVGLLTKSLVEYHVGQLITSDIVIRSICTSNHTSKCLKSSFPKLEQPNIITGVTAGALCLREVIDKPATVLVCYIEHPEEEQIPELQELLETFKIVADTKKVKRNNILHSNLYI